MTENNPHTHQPTAPRELTADQYRAVCELRIGAMCWEQDKRDRTGEHGPSRHELNLILVDDVVYP